MKVEPKAEIDKKVLPTIRELATFQTWVQEQFDARDATIAELKALLGECKRFMEMIEDDKSLFSPHATRLLAAIEQRLAGKEGEEIK